MYSLSYSDNSLTDHSTGGLLFFEVPFSTVYRGLDFMTQSLPW
jgi:hypothetical protein